MTKHIVTGIRPFNFVNDNGEKVEGVTVYYLDTHNENTEYGKGHTALNLTLIGDHLGKFKELPAVYDMDFRQSRDNKGRPTLRLQDLEYVEPFSLQIQ